MPKRESAPLPAPDVAGLAGPSPDVPARCHIIMMFTTHSLPQRASAAGGGGDDDDDDDGNDDDDDDDEDEDEDEDDYGEAIKKPLMEQYPLSLRPLPP
eukprot:gene14396-biopygen11325